MSVTMEKHKMAGILEKRNKRIGWSKRRVSLLNDKIIYSRKSNSVEDKQVMLKEIISVQCKGRIIEIDLGKETKIELRAQNEIDSFSWVQALNSAVANIKPIMTKPIGCMRKYKSLRIDTRTTSDVESKEPCSPRSVSSQSCDTPRLIRARSYTPQSVGSHPRSDSFNYPRSPSVSNRPSDASSHLSRGSSFDVSSVDGEYVKKLWERRTLHRRRTNSARLVRQNSDNLKKKGTKLKQTMKKNIIQTSKETTEANNKVIAFFSSFVAKIFSPILFVLSKTVKSNEEFVKSVENDNNNTLVK